MSIEVKLGLEQLAGIDIGSNRKKINNQESNFDILIKTFDEFKGLYKIMLDQAYRGFKHSDMVKRLADYINDKNIIYSEQDLIDFIEYHQTKDLRGEGIEEYFGVHIGDLITLLTEKNEAQGKRTIITIEENHLNRLGYFCNKFDVVRIKVNYGDDVFGFVTEGNLLCVDNNFGNDFTQYAAISGKRVKAIVGHKVKDKESFGKNAHPDASIIITENKSEYEELLKRYGWEDV